MLVITIKKLDLKRFLNEKKNSLRFKMVFGYIILTFIILFLMCVYITELVSKNLYESETGEMFAKANIISESISSNWSDYHYEIIDNGTYNWLEDIVGGGVAGSDIRGILTDTSYTVIYDTNPDGGLIGRALVRDTIKSALSGSSASALLNTETGTKLLCVAVPIKVEKQNTGAVYLTASADKITSVIKSVRTGMIAFSFVVCLLMGLLSFFLSRALMSPLDGFIKVAREISKGNFSHRMEVKGEGEVAELSEAMNYMCAELEHLDERRRKFVSDASHELKTPMATIKLLCDSIVSTQDPDMGMVREFLNDLSDEIDRLTRLIESLLTLTKLDSAETELKPVLVDFGILLKKIEKSLSTMAAKRNISLYTEILTDDMQPIMVDYDKIWEAVYNILDNAIKYSKSGGAVKISAIADDMVLTVAISDSGNGIPDEYKERIFERFYRLDDSRARETGGTGLGLSIARETVEMHGGSIKIQDNEQGGSIFVISLPYKDEKMV